MGQKGGSWSHSTTFTSTLYAKNNSWGIRINVESLKIIWTVCVGWVCHYLTNNKRQCNWNQFSVVPCDHFVNWLETTTQRRLSVLMQIVQASLFVLQCRTIAPGNQHYLLQVFHQVYRALLNFIVERIN